MRAFSRYLDARPLLAVVLGALTAFAILVIQRSIT
jgi:hypothetical protein